ncbi:FAD-dependent oxidoreductase [Rhodobacterales bacterium LSUCC0387]|nr:FAD-dependent oxidoreductase [Rhodobacterales bacterium LSUCC0387]
MTNDALIHASSVVVIGAGFTGLSLAYELAKKGIEVTVLESQDQLGGLAGSFEINGANIEKFYHHWFTNDLAAMRLIEDLGLQSNLIIKPSRTGIYVGNNFFKLSNPVDLLRFKPLSMIGRIRLGLLTLMVRRVSDWRALESKTAAEWLRKMCGDEVYKVVWEPLLRGKFGNAAEDVSAVWIWNKLKLRGSSRGKGGKEQLAYYQGGFSSFIENIADEIRKLGGVILTQSAVTELVVSEGRVTGVVSNNTSFIADAVVATPSLPVIAELLEKHGSQDYLEKLRSVKYLANICIVLELKRSLSSTYWLNVNDPGFPFVAVIEHTNFASPDNYGGSHIVYLSKYLPEQNELFTMGDDEVVDYTLSHLKRMFPEFGREWIVSATVWRAKCSQPIVSKWYSSVVPEADTELAGFYINTMAQIYPEDRGTNYAIRQGRRMASRFVKS